jgi:hypothetical protein
MFDYSDAPMIAREARRREAMTSMRLGTELEWSSRFLAQECLGDGFFAHPLLAAPGAWRDQAVAVVMSGEIVDGRGVHSQATFGAYHERPKK